MPDFGRGNNGGDPSLDEINRTDQFLDALASQQQPYVTDHGEAELANLLAGWRDDVRETPMGHVLPVQDAAAALDRATRPAPRRRLSLAVVGSAAAAMLAIGGFGAVIAGSGPGDAMYGLRTMLFGEQAQPRDDAVILAAQTEMQQVQQLIEQGDWQGAQQKLEAVTTTVATVNDLESRQELVTQWQELTVKVEAQDPAATIAPGAPLPTFPELPLIVLDPGTSPSGDTTEPEATPSPSDTTPPEATPSEATPSPAPDTTAPDTTAPDTTAPDTTAPEATPSPSGTTTAPTTPAPTTPAPTTTRPPEATTTSAAATPSPTTTRVPETTTTSVGASPTSPTSPTSTTVTVQSTTRAALPTTTSVTVPSPVSSPAIAPTSVPSVEEEPAPSPAPAPLPTTTPVILLPVPGAAG
ncbi:anti-sigma-D factor RsdA [Mycobacterium sp. smrl_JER01]|uniref:anti-sigma-D factor RsdA n=1 Tax=Mycobacterium sp. smrl_JER01 TaxID=3402633 RepID=UPI003AC54A12